MSAEPRDHEEAWADVRLAMELFAVDPTGLGGVVLRARAGPQRDQVCAWLRELLPRASPVLRIPLHVTEDRLLGGLALADTLRAGHVVLERGLLAQADGGAVVLAMAERIEPLVASNVCSALDRSEVLLERDGITACAPCRIGVLALDEGIDDERAPAALRDRLAFHVDLDPIDPRASAPTDFTPGRTERARALLPGIGPDERVIEALSQAAVALGVFSLRGPLLAATAARAHAALEGRTRIEDADAAAAARLVFGPRATRMPTAAAEDAEAALPTEPDDPAESEKDRERTRPRGEVDDPAKASDRKSDPGRPLEEVVLEAAKSAIPPGLLDALSSGREPRAASRSSGQSGAVRASTQGGRPSGTRAAVPRPGERLNLVETLRAAAPWQRLRRGGRSVPASAVAPRIEVRKEDFRVTRFQQRAESSVIFSVDASGSAALQRLAEAKGAVEQVLADCYVRRDNVALIAFRGTTAVLLLAPTRSLARVRRSLADLAGGGTTPLSAGIDAALALALSARKSGKTPVVVLMTDGRANVGKNGRGGGAEAAADATSSARAVRSAGVRALFLDTAPRPRAQARLLAAEMGARYLPLPYVDAAAISRHVQSVAAGAP